MVSMIKRYVPYALVILLVYMFVPLIFVLNGTGTQQHPVTYDVIFPLTAIVCSVIYGKKHGIDFFFSLVAPIIYIPSMLIYNGISTNNIIFVAIYLAASIFGLFFGDMFFGSKEKGPEAPLDVDLDIDETEPVKTANKAQAVKKPLNATKAPAPVRKSSPKSPESRTQADKHSDGSDDFFDNYSSDNHTDVKASAEDEIDKILREIRNKD
ncbi:MAG: hypothetical protein PUD24_03450 [Oscillospiraceae bacterium]|nr:hypothetical protein [Oscillospiraceae bacterium]